MNEKANDSVKIEEPEMEKKENEGECSTKKRTKEERSKKKEDKRPSEQYLKILSHVSSPEDKLDVMCKKYSQILDENRRLSLALKHSEKKVELLLREREQLQIERSKSIMTRKRLENLCRELQKQNKIVKNESLQRVKEQEEIRKDLSEKFQGGLAQITTLMNQNIEKNAKMYEENLEINKKFKAVYEQVEQKEQQLLKVHQQMKIDLQIADAKLAKVKMEAIAEKEALLKEKQQLLLKMTEYQTQIKELQATEVGLRSEISMYTDKYDEFQNALNRSNKIYGEFNVEMEKMTKKLYVLEKETSLWKQRWANSHDALLAMAADKQTSDGEIAMLSKKLTLLQDLCKMFQCERTKLLAQLKAQDNKAPSQEATTVPAESQEVAKYMKQMDELPNVENTFEQLQASLASVTEAMRNGSNLNSKAATTKTVNSASTKNQKQNVAKGELDEKKVKRLQANSENANKDSNKSNTSSKLNDETTKQSDFHVDSVTLNYLVETQKIESTSQESSNTSELTITEITDEKSDELVGSSKSEEINEDSHKLQTELLKTENINEEISNFVSAKTPESTQMNDKSDVIQDQIDLKETNESVEVEQQNKVSEQSPDSSKVTAQVPDIVENILQELDLPEKEIDLLRSKVNNHINEESKSPTNENEDKNSRTHEDTSKTVEEDEDVEIACTNLNMDYDKTLSVDNIQDNEDAIVESNIEAVIESINNSELVTKSNSILVENISEVLKIDDIAATENATSTVKEKFAVVSETANKLDDSSSKLADNTINAHMANDTLLRDEDTSKSEIKTTCMPVIKNVTSSKDALTKTSMSENDCAEEKLNKPASTKKRRKK